VFSWVTDFNERAKFCPPVFWFVQKFLEAEGLLLFIAALVLIFLPVGESEKFSKNPTGRAKK